MGCPGILGYYPLPAASPGLAQCKVHHSYSMLNEAHQIKEGLLEHRCNEVDYKEQKIISIIYPSGPSENVTTLPKAFTRSPREKRDPVLSLLPQHVIQISLLTSTHLTAIIVCVSLFI